MRAVVTRVKNASVEIDGKVHGIIETGFLVLLGVKVGDTEADALKLADKITALRVFEDENGKMNLGLDEVGVNSLSYPSLLFTETAKRPPPRISLGGKA